HGGEHHQLGEIDEVSGPRDHGVTEGVDAAAVAEEIHAEPLAAALKRRPERFARLDQHPEDAVRQRPDAGPRRENRRPAPAVDGELDVAARYALRRDLSIRA